MIGYQYPPPLLYYAASHQNKKATTENTKNLTQPFFYPLVITNQTNNKL